MPETEEEQQPRRMSAQDKYAQEALDFLWAHKDALEEAEPGVYIFTGSIHQFIRRNFPSAQAGDVINIMRTSGAIDRIGQGLWQIIRKKVFFDDEGKPVRVVAKGLKHDSRIGAAEKLILQVGKELVAIREQNNACTTIVLELARRNGIDVMELVETASRSQSEAAETLDLEDEQY